MLLNRIIWLSFAISYIAIFSHCANPSENLMSQMAQFSNYKKQNKESKYALLPDPKEMAMHFINGTEKEQRAFDYMYQSMLSQFDVEGYNWLMNEGNHCIVNI